MHDAGLDDGGRPDLRDGLRQPGKPVADQEMGAVAGAAVFDLGEDVQPAVGAPGRRRRPTGARMSRSPSTVTASAR
jgi:hypothetical protein